MWRFFLLLVAFGLVSALPSANAEGPVGSITKLKGHAVVKRQGQQLDAAPSMPILRSDEIVTDPGGGVTMLNGSRLTLGESTSIVIDESIVAADQHSKSLIHLAVGRLRAVVETIGATSPDVKIHTQNAIAAARGTDFEVDFIEGKPCPQQPSCLRYTTVGVYKGTVEVTNPTSPPGHHLSMSPPAIRPTYPARLRLHRWHRGELKNSGRGDTARKHRANEE
jgi:hypothetical protein